MRRGTKCGLGLSIPYESMPQKVPDFGPSPCARRNGALLHAAGGMIAVSILAAAFGALDRARHFADLVRVARLVPREEDQPLVDIQGAEAGVRNLDGAEGQAVGGDDRLAQCCASIR